ncbi:hypothetical protein EPN52_02430 [bacterium]|nr:MAG: hypothetical protein EPN52_02430 [bacterium]
MNDRSRSAGYTILLGAVLYASAGTAIASAEQQPVKTIPIAQSAITSDLPDSDPDDETSKSSYQRAVERRERLRARHLLLEVGP